MRSLLKIFRNKWLIIFLATLATIIGFLYFWFKGLPGETEDLLLPKLSSPEIRQHLLEIEPGVDKLEKEFTDPPQALSVYQVDKPQLSHTQANEIAGRLGFQNPPQIFQDIELGPIYNWSSEESYLSITVNQGSVSYSLDLLAKPELKEGNSPSLEEAETIASSFLENGIIPLPQKSKLTIKSVRYLKTSGPAYSTVGLQEEADLVQVDFQIKIEERELFQSVPKESLLKIRIGPGAKIISLNYQAPFNQIRPFDSYPLKTKDEVLREIEALPKITYLEFPERYLPTEEDYQKIQVIDFREIKLGYYQPLMPEAYLQPVFLISGGARLSDGRIGNVYLYLPAIAEKYLTPGP